MEKALDEAISSLKREIKRTLDIAYTGRSRITARRDGRNRKRCVYGVVESLPLSPREAVEGACKRRHGVVAVAENAR